MTALSPSQIDQWHRDGYLFPLPLLTEAERQACLDGLARFEAWLGAPVNASKDLKWRTMPHLVLPWVAALARDPRITDPVADLLGPDLLVFTGTFFIKEAGTPTISDWHQDSTYYGIQPLDVVTVWVALSEASVAAGCMDVLPFDGEPALMPHAAGVVENSVNRAAQRITVDLDESRAVAMPLAAGQFSMHHGLTPHRSGPNTSDHRRIGLGLNYLPASSRPVGVERTCAMLARGTDRHGHFEPVQPPDAELSDAAIATHEMAVARYGATYREQEPLHAQKFG